MAQEFEIKARLPDLSVLRSLVMGFSEGPETHQSDLYIDTSERSLFRNGIFLRIRDERLLQIKYTPDTTDLAHLKCEEDEFRLPLTIRDSEKLRALIASALPNLDGSPATVAELRDVWGLADFLWIEKFRKQYVGDGVVVSVDTVTGLGQFVEIEVTDPRLQCKYLSLAQELGLDLVSIGYVELALREKEPDTYKFGRFVLESDIPLDPSSKI